MEPRALSRKMGTFAMLPVGKKMWEPRLCAFICLVGREVPTKNIVQKRFEENCKVSNCSMTLEK
jgi:hypothetical protein